MAIQSKLPARTLSDQEIVFAGGTGLILGSPEIRIREDSIARSTGCLVLYNKGRVLRWRVLRREIITELPSATVL